MLLENLCIWLPFPWLAPKKSLMASRFTQDTSPSVWPLDPNEDRNSRGRAYAWIRCPLVLHSFSFLSSISFLFWSTGLSFVLYLSFLCSFCFLLWPVDHERENDEKINNNYWISGFPKVNSCILLDNSTFGEAFEILIVVSIPDIDFSEKLLEDLTKDQWTRSFLIQRNLYSAFLSIFRAFPKKSLSKEGSGR